jgi:hypothetical protein
VLGNDRQAAWDFIRVWRERAVSAAVETVQIIHAKEREAFGGRSYFQNLEQSLLHRVGFPEYRTTLAAEVVLLPYLDRAPRKKLL